MPNAMGESDQENRSMADQIDYAARFGLTLAEAYQVALDVYRRGMFNSLGIVEFV